MLDPSLIYGKSHTLFFIFSGLTTLLVWTSIISLDEFWKKYYNKEATKLYPFLVNIGGLVALILYDRVNKVFSFKTQLRYFPFSLTFSFVILYLVGLYLDKTNDNESSGVFGKNLRNLFFIVMLTFMGFFNAILQISLTRYTFNFSASKISLFNAGTALSGILFSSLYIIITKFGPEKIEEQSSGPKYVLWFIGLLFVIVIVNFFVFENYIKQFLDRKDDLTGETDSLREIIDNEERTTSLSSVFRKILAMFFCLILCYSITMSCFPVLAFAVGSDWFDQQNMVFKGATISLIFSVFDGLGKYSYKWLKMRDNVVVYIYSLSRLLLVIGYIFAADKSLTYKFFQQKSFGYFLLFVLAFTNGHFTSAAFSLASQRCENKSKKTCGYLMTVSLFLGLVYGGLISATCLEDRASIQS